MGFQPARAVLIGVDHHRHARNARGLGMSDGQRLDVERAAPEQRGHAIEDARLVLDVDRKCMQHALLPTASHEDTKRTRSTRRTLCTKDLRGLRDSSSLRDDPSLHFQSAAVSTIGDGLLIILSRSAPAGTIGYTESSCSTWKSITAARFWRRADSTAPATSARVVMVAAEIPNASASFWKFGPLIGVAA